MSRLAKVAELLRDDVHLVAGEIAKLSAVNKLMASNYTAWMPRRRDAEDSATGKLVAAGAVIRYSGGDTSIRFRGLKATSTHGLPGALANWKAAAEQRLSERVTA